MHSKRIIWLLLLLFFSLPACNKDLEGEELNPPEKKESQHPFLIVSKDQFETMRSRADQEPWKSMKSDAIERSSKGSKTSPYDLQFYIGAAALAYILDETGAKTHANRVRDAIIEQNSKLEFNNGSDWGGVVPPMGSAFVAILALDIVYDALTEDEIKACEEVISNQIFKIERKGSWADVRLGTHGAWDIYKGVRSTPDDEYFESIMNQITEDGVSPVTNHYAWERVGGGNSRISKSGYMDVLEFTGIDNRYYSNERLQKFHRWLFGSSVNCNREMAIFGDMLPTQGISNDMLHRRVVNFDMEAAGYAAWFHKDRPAIGHILTYILPLQALPAPLVPTSKIYPDGGAFFRENSDNPLGLHGVLYNIQSSDEWHTHNEVNGLALSGLGNRLLVNGGRLGEPTRAAYLNNTLTINGANHDSRLGGGIAEGFTTAFMDYACAVAGPALRNGTHARSLVLVHGQNPGEGYFVLFDEVKAKPGDQIKNYLHPANQSAVSEVSPMENYQASIDHFPTVEGTGVQFYFATQPADVVIEKVASAVPDRYPDYPEHSRIEAVYNVDTDGNKQVVTVIAPTNSNIQARVAEKLSGAQFSGCRINNGENGHDFVIESDGEMQVQIAGQSFVAKLMISKYTEGLLQYFFVRNGKAYSMGNTGFDSDHSISMFYDGNHGVICSEGATVTLRGKNMESVAFTPEIDIIDRGVGFVKIKIPAGEIRIN